MKLVQFYELELNRTSRERQFVSYFIIRRSVAEIDLIQREGGKAGVGRVEAKINYLSR